MTNDFQNYRQQIYTDKAMIDVLPSHRFYELSQHLSNYQGVDILPLTQNNELLTGSIKDKIIKSKPIKGKPIKKCQNLLNNHFLPQACVLIVITDENCPKLLLTRRSYHLNSHAGEVSLVGGKRDDADLNSIGVALREAYEEVGLASKDVTVLGYLPMQVSKSGLLVRPVVACVSPSVADGLTSNPDEIARIFWLPIDVLNAPPADYVFDGQADNTKLHTPAWVYDCNDDGQVEVIWGLTGRILASLMEIGFGVRHEWYYKVR
ncbi:CoA pyrophosphatase [Moraxella nasovis]|uniref:NUDIX hydrolase n=1 Tax=Moraxella nasovis TaxID=2904121 RepID=UPI001F62157D|nr:CoA pyrophosphatase [Moraxella nasovis]UNU74014.1 CoA pyrophosphatase [Moraxella nasovis]